MHLLESSGLKCDCLASCVQQVEMLHTTALHPRPRSDSIQDYPVCCAVLCCATLCLQARNILLKSSGGAEGRPFVAKVADFGLSMRIDPDATHVSNVYQVRAALFGTLLQLSCRQHSSLCRLPALQDLVTVTRLLVDPGINSGRHQTAAGMLARRHGIQAS